MQNKRLLLAMLLFGATVLAPVALTPSPALAYVVDCSATGGPGPQPGLPGDEPEEPQQGQQMTPEEMRAFVASHESPNGLAGNPHVYIDTKGHPTVGVGFNLDRPDARDLLTKVGANYDAVRAGTQDLTPHQIATLFEADFVAAAATVQRYIYNFDSLTPSRQAVLIDMAFNLGPAGFRGFRNMINAVNVGNWEAAARAMSQSLWATQVGIRAVQDIKLMRQGAMCQDGDAPAAPPPGGNHVNYPGNVWALPDTGGATVGGGSPAPISCRINHIEVYYEGHWIDIAVVDCY
ncbi:glycoside hydrolase family protein [Micromonospora sp. NPDC049366]|uniref:glycoside hydrolase family protein n=1 Tax=Micromonospora sp. NPDC049366 TaxID=3364271 RepID=UPI0037987BE2